MGCGTIAALALTAGGMGVQEYAGAQTRKAMNNAVGNEIAAQNQFAKQGQDVFNQSLNQSTPQAAQNQIGQGQQQALQSIQSVQANPMSLSMPSFGNVNTAQESAKRDMSNTAASNYFGQGNYGLQQYLKNLQANSQLGVIGGQAGQEARNFPTYLQTAQNSEQGLQGIGQLLSTGGMLAGLSGLASAAAGSKQGMDYWGMARPGSYGNVWQNGKWMAFQ